MELPSTRLNVITVANNRSKKSKGSRPVTKRTLINSQLQDARYSAEDFRKAHFNATELSYNWYWNMFQSVNEDHLTLGYTKWELTYSFFPTGKIPEDGYRETELWCTGFSEEDLHDSRIRSSRIRSPRFSGSIGLESGSAL